MPAPYERVLFVCTSGKTCPAQGSEAVHAALKEAAFSAGLGERVRVNKSGCMSQCGHGPMIAVYPEGRWYSAVRVEDVPELLDREVRAGSPVERLLYSPEKPGKNVCAPGAKPGTLPACAPPSPSPQ